MGCEVSLDPSELAPSNKGLILLCFRLHVFVQQTVSWPYTVVLSHFNLGFIQMGTAIKNDLKKEIN